MTPQAAAAVSFGFVITWGGTLVFG